MQDTGYLNRLLSDAVNNDEREAGDKHFPRLGLAAFSSTVIDRVCHTAGRAAPKRSAV
jgi:hypothetical protein